MGILIDESAFDGKWQLAKSNEDLIDEYIEEYEEKFLTELLGKELFDLFQDDLNAGVPATPIYETIFEAFTQKINGCIVSSEGMKKMLTGLIYFEYVRDNRVKQTMNGAVEQQTEVSTASDNTFLYSRYNQAVKTYQAIQAYIINNKDSYPSFDGITKKTTSFI
jgi:hypothetical protein